MIHCCSFLCGTTSGRGILRYITYLHGILYAQEQGWDHTFEAYVAGPLAEFALSQSSRQRIWIVEREQKIVGTVAVAEHSQEEAQFRWLLVDPSTRREGLGRRLAENAIEFSRTSGYQSIFSWTVGTLTAAASLYVSFGFKITEESKALSPAGDPQPYTYGYENMKPKAIGKKVSASSPILIRLIRKSLFICLLFAVTMPAICFIFGWRSLKNIGTGFIYGSLGLALFGDLMLAGNTMPAHLSKLSLLKYNPSSFKRHQEAESDGFPSRDEGVRFFFAALISGAFSFVTGLFLKMLR